jgi:hypothetical protein
MQAKELRGLRLQVWQGTRKVFIQDSLDNDAFPVRWA